MVQIAEQAKSKNWILGGDDGNNLTFWIPDLRCWYLGGPEDHQEQRQRRQESTVDSDCGRAAVGRTHPLVPDGPRQAGL